MIWLGIDPGRRGAVAKVYEHGACAIEDLPVDDNGRLQAHAFALALRRMVPAELSCTIAIEALHARPGFDLRSQGELLRMAGAIGAVCDVCRFPVVEVDPKTWKRFYGLKADKRASVETAAVLFPDAGLSLVKDNNRAEALLIAHYARKKLQP